MSGSHRVEHILPTLPMHIFESTKSGPTVVVQAGIHGDEIAGVHALEELLEEGVSIASGTLYLIPVMNPGAYRARQRCAPGGLDLNRSFPGDAGAEAVESRLARTFMDLMERERPALVLTLHESWKRYHPDVPQSFAQTLIYGVKPMPQVVGRVVDTLNQALEHPYELWASHYYPVDTSSTEVIVEAIGCVGVCAETWMGFELSRRVQMQKALTRAFLKEFNIL